jgi:hypothetical protein
MPLWRPQSGQRGNHKLGVLLEKGTGYARFSNPKIKRIKKTGRAKYTWIG